MTRTKAIEYFKNHINEWKRIESNFNDEYLSLLHFDSIINHINEWFSKSDIDYCVQFKGLQPKTRSILKALINE